MNNVKLDSIDFVALFEEISNSTTKAEMVKAFYSRGIVNHTKMTSETKNGQDQYITLKDDKGRSTHLLIQKNRMRLFTFDDISRNEYFKKYVFTDYSSDGPRTKSVRGIAKNAEEFEYILRFFLQYDINWVK